MAIINPYCLDCCKRFGRDLEFAEEQPDDIDESERICAECAANRKRVRFGNLRRAVKARKALRLFMGNSKDPEEIEVGIRDLIADLGHLHDALPNKTDDEEFGDLLGAAQLHLAHERHGCSCCP